jgi:hypothetical protein
MRGLCGADNYFPVVDVEKENEENYDSICSILS